MPKLTALAVVLTALAATAQAQDDGIVFNVVINDEEQYSIWPADREKPLGWQYAYGPCAKQECLAYIEEVWTDVRPKSLRDKIGN